nr:sugar transferase [Metabacillus indicus]
MQKEYYYEEIEEIDLSDKKAYLMIKRVLDILLSSVSLIVAIPIILITSIFIKLESKGPAFFKQERSGLNGKSFNIYKLRSMSTDAEKNGPQWASKDDNRVTKVGKFIRKTRIDELPQLFNVFKGDMTIFGPRPERPIFVEQFSKEIPGFDKRTIVKPGLTGWAQVNGGYDISPEDKLKLDLFYIRNMSLALDFKIMLKTVKVVLTGEGAR